MASLGTKPSTTERYRNTKPSNIDLGHQLLSRLSWSQSRFGLAHCTPLVGVGEQEDEDEDDDEDDESDDDEDDSDDDDSGG